MSALPVVTSIAVSMGNGRFGLVRRTITSMDLRINFDPTIFRYQLVGNWYPFVNLNALFDNSIMFHTGKDARQHGLYII